MQPYTLVLDGEMFLTYAVDEATARGAFADELGELDEGARVRKQPMRKPEEFRYTRAGETVTATLVGGAPRDED